MIFSVSIVDFEQGTLTATAYPDNVAVSGDAVFAASSQEGAQAAIERLALEEWAAPESRHPTDLEIDWDFSRVAPVDPTPAFKAWVEAAKSDLKYLGRKSSSAELARMLGVSQQTLNQAEKGHKAVTLDRLVGWLDTWNQVAPQIARRWALEVSGKTVALKAEYPVGFYRVVDTFNETIVSRHPTLDGAVESLRSQVHSCHKIQVKTEEGWKPVDAEGNLT